METQNKKNVTINIDAFLKSISVSVDTKITDLKEQITSLVMNAIKEDVPFSFDQIDSLEAAINYLGEEDPDVIEYRKIDDAGIMGHALHAQILIVIIKAINEKWKPNYSDGNEYKWEPRFRIEPGVGLSLYDCDSWYAYSTVGPRFVFKSKERLLFAVKTFIKEYNNFFTK
jgi:hypothetical protein